MQKQESTYHHEDLKAELLEAGIKLVSEEGFQTFSLRKLAVECNVSHQAPYSHFENKEKFLEEMQKYITEKFSAELFKFSKTCFFNVRNKFIGLSLSRENCDNNLRKNITKIKDIAKYPKAIRNNGSINFVLLTQSS